MWSLTFFPSYFDAYLVVGGSLLSNVEINLKG